jgi:hypothetical protein
MVDKLKQAVPLAVAFGVLAFAWIEISLNFSFHWFDNGDLGNGLGLPANFHLVAPAAFITWALFFAAGADMAAATKVAIATVIGATAGLVLMVASPATADLPDFWGIAVWVGILGFGAVILSVFDWYYAPASLAAFTAVGFWWLVTGMDGWAEKVAESVAGSSPSLSRRPRALAPSAGFFSTPYPWVWVGCLASLLVGVVLGLLSTVLAGEPWCGHRKPRQDCPAAPAGLAPTRRGGVGAQNRRPRYGTPLEVTPSR